MMRQVGEKAVGLAAIAEMVPWLLVGFLVLIGSTTVAIYGLPFQSKEDGQRDERQMAQIAEVVDRLADKVNAISESAKMTQQEVNDLARQQTEIDDIRKQMIDQAIHDDRSGDPYRRTGSGRKSQ